MKYETRLSVAYSQIYLEDFTCRFHSHNAQWNADEVNSMLCVGQNYLIVGTESSIEVPFSLNILDEKPIINLESWDHVNLCSLQINSGLMVSGDFDTKDEMLKINLESGIYGIYTCYTGLDTISKDGLTGNDSYHAYMWPTIKVIAKKVLKQWVRRTSA